MTNYKKVELKQNPKLVEKTRTKIVEKKNLTEKSKERDKARDEKKRNQDA